MSEKVTVTSCIKDDQSGKYLIGLSDGDTDVSDRERALGSEWVPDGAEDVGGAAEPPVMAVTGAVAVVFDGVTRKVTVMFDGAARWRGSIPEVEKIFEDNAMLQRGLNEATDTISRLRNDLRQAQRAGSEIHGGYIDATPAKLDDMHTLDQLPVHKPMPSADNYNSTLTDHADTCPAKFESKGVCNCGYKYVERSARAAMAAQEGAGE